MATPESSPEQPLVSAIIPAYNHARFIGRCLDSLLNEGYPSLEVLIVDDGSIDGTYEAALEWRTKHASAFVRFVLIRQSNCGITRVWNRLVGLAEGEFIVGIDSDDYLLPGGITARISALRSRPDWMAVLGDSIVIDEADTILNQSCFQERYGANLQALMDDRFRAAELILRWTVAGSTLAARRSAFDPVHGIGLFDEDALTEDWGFCLRALRRNALGFIPNKVAAYRIHASNTSSRPDRHIPQTECLVRTARKEARQGSARWRIALHLEARRLMAGLNSWKAGRMRCSVSWLWAKVYWRFFSQLRALLIVVHDLRVHFFSGSVLERRFPDPQLGFHRGQSAYVSPSLSQTTSRIE
jgi:glycosyltransferase involved in cell wall biosynthesis